MRVRTTALLEDQQVQMQNDLQVALLRGAWLSDQSDKKVVTTLQVPGKPLSFYIAVATIAH